ncbi:Di-sulfide bridge nucleocytoplasmic transport domain-containing protein [Podospora didyma]|uniref:Di-sulfide bridge nucleocytoplasmic transport domain-containing protein n=1 Tax=Podospora didyma TaxID=330526 RepID=A0AAE0K9F5_9PEZI|nr:Di-sulfide bridge nucleocytoplasmic transport domain-containing protein [Podospora didyma]
MEYRGREGHMDWEQTGPVAVDPSSPFAKVNQGQPISFNSPSKSSFIRSNPNMFSNGYAARSSSPIKAPLFQHEPRPPHTSFFNPEIANKPSGPPFRNPAFTTPQKRVAETHSYDYESSPALTDVSEAEPDTPDVDHDGDFGRMTITPHSAGKALLGKNMVRSRTPGRGELPRGNRDKVRKRKRLQGDRDVGTGRSRLAHASDDSDSDWEGGSGTSKSSKGNTARRGWVASFLSVVSDHPSAPAILSKWLQLGVNIVLLGVVLLAVVAILSQIRSDLAHASERERHALINKITICGKHYIQNGCSPKAGRAPALEDQCNEWEHCMNQDPEAIMRVQVSVRNVAEIMNEFVGVLTAKTWIFIMSLFVVTLVASNIGFGFLRESALSQANMGGPAPPFHSQPAHHPALGSAMHDPRQAYIVAPIGQTPRHVRRNFFAHNDPSDTENSPEVRSIMPPQTPSGRRSPSKGDRGRSPSKGQRSPSKGY